MIFDPLSAASILVLAASSQGSLCSMPRPTKIDVVPHTRVVKYDYTKSLRDLESVQTDTIDPHSFNGVPITQGFMKGAIRLVPKVELDYKIYTVMKAACVWYDKITIDIEIEPHIIIAREVNADPCMGQAVRDHELKHVRADRKIVNKYSGIMGRKVHDALKERGFMAGPVPADSVKLVAERMQKIVFQVVEHEYKKMELERIELQREVDTLEEYQRVSARCPDFNPGTPQQKRPRSKRD